MIDKFYREFEDRHRGSREVIKQRLEVYLPFLKYAAPQNKISAVDLGCGRGEWLEILSSVGIQAIGVDLDKGMLEACHSRGLSVIEYDALQYLCDLPNESQNIITSFHVVEHMKFEELRQLVTEALRVLKPGGILIMETPNPENILVSTRNFYLDPTHIRPIPPQLLSFVAEYAGFRRVKILRLQEPKDLASKNEVTLMDVFAGASPDYSIVAQKEGFEYYPEKLQNPFDVTYGMSSEDLISRRDVYLDDKFKRIESKIIELEAKKNKFALKLKVKHKISRLLRFFNVLKK